MNRHKLYCALFIGCALLLAHGHANEGDPPNATMDSLERQLELHKHRDLLERMAATGSTLAPFTTDGCSGGLSAGWEYLAEEIEDVRSIHGKGPPWEDCCIEHDRHYHAGPGNGATAEESFEARKQADLALQACVVETGQTRAQALSAEYGVSPGSVDILYAVIAELMYRAVRLGGVPCSGLPWRWGYGWPECG